MGMARWAWRWQDGRGHGEGHGKGGMSMAMTQWPMGSARWLIVSWIVVRFRLGSPLSRVGALAPKGRLPRVHRARARVNAARSLRRGGSRGRIVVGDDGFADRLRAIELTGRGTLECAQPWEGGGLKLLVLLSIRGRRRYDLGSRRLSVVGPTRSSMV